MPKDSLVLYYDLEDPLPIHKPDPAMRGEQAFYSSAQYGIEQWLKEHPLDWARFRSQGRYLRVEVDAVEDHGERGVRFNVPGAKAYKALPEGYGRVAPSK
jgi:hypothetical protein